MADIFYNDSGDVSSLENLTLGLVGYGNQGRAHALNLRDSGLTVKIGTRRGSKACQQAIEDGFERLEISEVAKGCDLIALMLPDEQMPSVYAEQIAPNLRPGSGLVFAHGFVFHHKTIAISKETDVILVAPTGPGRQVRTLYVEGLGLPALVAVGQDFTGKAWERCLAYAKAIGCTRAGAIKTTFAEETVTDLFCEQAVLCGGIPELIKASFETLTSKGYQKELAYISCLKEVKLIADLLFQQGVDGMRQAISNTAKYGSAVAGPKIIDGRTREALLGVLENIESGEFARDFMNDTADGAPAVKDLVESEKQSGLAKVGNELRTSLKF